MKVAALIATAFALAAGSAAACTPHIELSPAGSRESPEARYRRTQRQVQQQAWKDADYVFLAQVRSLRSAGEDRMDAGLRELETLRGDERILLRRDSYKLDFGGACGSTPYPKIDEFGVFYARRAPWRQQRIPWAPAQVDYAVPITDVFDPRIPVEMRAAAARIRKSQP